MDDIRKIKFLHLRRYLIIIAFHIIKPKRYFINHNLFISLKPRSVFCFGVMGVNLYWFAQIMNERYGHNNAHFASSCEIHSIIVRHKILIEA